MPGSDVLERIRAELGGSGALQGPVYSPSGRELTSSEAVEWRVTRVDAKLELMIELGREPQATLGIPDLRPVPVWVQAAVLSIGVGLFVTQGFGLLAVLILWIKV
jgi:hypothetical protein